MPSAARARNPLPAGGAAVRGGQAAAGPAAAAAARRCAYVSLRAAGPGQRPRPCRGLPPSPPGAGHRPPLPPAHLHAQVGQAGLQAGLQRQKEGGGGRAARRVG